MLALRRNSRRNRLKIRRTRVLKTGNILLRILIVGLSLYVLVKCIKIIWNKDVSTECASWSKAFANIVSSEMIASEDIVQQYIDYEGDPKSLGESIRERIVKALIFDCAVKCEYTLDGQDPSFEKVVNEIVANNEIEVVTQPPETTKKESETEKEKEAEKKDSQSNKKQLVPIPKRVGTEYNEKNIGTFKKVINKFYTITSATAMYSDDLKLKKAINEKFSIKGDNKKPQILIYHTHSQERFCNSTSDKNTSIIGVGNRLTKVLTEQFGYNVIHDTSTYDIVKGKLDRNLAYDQARDGIDAILKKYPSISLVIDVHRDGVGESTRLVTEVNGKKTAQIMFLNGMSRFKKTGDIAYLHNPYLYENLALALQMKLKAECYYPGFTRRNYVNAYEYNLDACKQSLLVEVGAQTNTYQEAQNSAEPLAVLVDMVMGKK